MTAKKLQPWQRSVRRERRRLDKRLCRLRQFIGTHPWCVLDSRAQNLMLQQLAAMKRYSDILRERIADF